MAALRRRGQGQHAAELRRRPPRPDRRSSSTATPRSRASSCRAAASRSSTRRALDGDRPDYVVILPWNMRDEVMAQLDYIARLGRSLRHRGARAEDARREGRRHRRDRLHRPARRRRARTAPAIAPSLRAAAWSTLRDDAAIESSDRPRRSAGDAFERIGRPDVLIHLAWGGLPNYRSLHHFEGELPAQYRFLRGWSAPDCEARRHGHVLRVRDAVGGARRGTGRRPATPMESRRTRSGASSSSCSASTRSPSPGHVSSTCTAKARRRALPQLGPIARATSRFRCREASSCATTCRSRRPPGTGPTRAGA